MRSFNKLAGLSVAALGLATLTTGAGAQTLFGTFGFTPSGTPTANNANVANATSITLASNDFNINSIPATFNGTQPNDFATGGAKPITAMTGNVALTTTTLSNGGSIGLTFIAGGTTFTFTPTTTLAFQGQSGTFGNFLAFSVFGNLSDGPTFVAQNAQLAGNFNQTAAGSAVNGSFTFSSPPLVPPTGVPEPGTVAMLAGMGVTGVGLLARRRK